MSDPEVTPAKASKPTRTPAKAASYNREYYQKNREKILAQARNRYQASPDAREQATRRSALLRNSIREGTHKPVPRGAIERVITRPDGTDMLVHMVTFGALGAMMNPDFKLHRIRNWVKQGWLPTPRHVVSEAQHQAYTTDEAEIICECYRTQVRLLIESGACVDWRATAKFREMVEAEFAKRLDAAGIAR